MQLPSRKPPSPRENQSLKAVFLTAMMYSDAVMQQDLALEEALLRFESAKGPPSVEECVFILQKCRKERNLSYARRAHKIIKASNLHTDRTLGSYIVAMFAECRSMVDARFSFDQLNHQNDYAWASLLQGYTQCGEPQHALALLPTLKAGPLSPSSHTYQAILKACAELKCLKGAREAHAEVMKDGFETDLHVGSVLVDVYVKCGLLEAAREVFDEVRGRDVVLWSTLIAGYADHGYGEEVLNCLTEMCREGISPNLVTFICGTKGCKNKGAGKRMHMEVSKFGFESSPIVGNTLISMYGLHGALKEARWVFAHLPVQCLVSWTALISGHTGHGAWEKALALFQQMQRDRAVPDAYVFTCTLRACGNVGGLDYGRSLHVLIINGGYEDEAFVGNSLVDMYGKCGSLLEAQDVFCKLPCQDIALWSALFAGHAYSGETAALFRLFMTMVRKGVQPDRVVFLSILTACSHAGLVETGCLCFQMMREMYGISETTEHYNCLVDLVGRAGRLHEAVVMLDLIPTQPNLVTWITLLGACRNLGNSELGRNAFEYALKLHTKHMGSLLLAKQILR